MGTQTIAVVLVGKENYFQAWESQKFRIVLSYLPGLSTTALEFLAKNQDIAPGIGAAITSAACITKTAETMKEATESNGGLILGSAAGFSIGALITMVGKMAKLRGGDERSTNWACGAATLLWGVVLQFSLIDLKNMSASELLFAWTAISVLSGLIAATIAHVLPRPNEQN